MTALAVRAGCYGVFSVVVQRQHGAAAIRREGFEFFIFDTRTVGAVGKLVVELWVVLAICEIGDDRAKEGSHEDIVPMVTIVHAARDGDEGGHREGGQGDPCFSGVASTVEEVQLASKVVGEEAKPSERHYVSDEESAGKIEQCCVYALLECPEGKLRNPSRRILLLVCVHISQLVRPKGGSVAPGGGIHRATTSRMNGGERLADSNWSVALSHSELSAKEAHQDEDGPQ